MCKTNFITPEVESFFIGTLLGDSYLTDNVFCCKLISKDLIEFKANFIREHLPDAKVTITEYNEYTDKNGVHHQKYYQLYASGVEYFKSLSKMFYKDKIKIYPKGSVKKLDDLGFAMWYADDGTTILVQISSETGMARSRRIQICTDNFTVNENNQIKSELEELGYNIKIIDRARKGRVRIQFNKTPQNFICRLEKPFLNFPSLLYKLDLGYRGKSLNKKTYVIEEYKNCFLRVSAHPQFRDRVKEKLEELSDDIVQTTNNNCYVSEN